jgi:hypothetical protein
VAVRIGDAGGAASACCTSKLGLTGLTQALAAEGAPLGIRAVCPYPGAMATHWGTWNPADRDQPGRAAPEDALPPEDVAQYIAWLVCVPAHLIVTEAVVAPIGERGLCSATSHATRLGDAGFTLEARKLGHRVAVIDERWQPAPGGLAWTR